MRVLLVGGGGREHTLAWKLSRSRQLKQLYIAPGNPGTVQLGANVKIKDNDIVGLVRFAQEKKIDLVAVGPEDPLAAGLVDALSAVGIRAFGPTAGGPNVWYMGFMEDKILA
ncbi:MAG: phosphoribosylamine--glycine ligase, partial [Sedimentisphaerales bacterium]|nr:phosphoribosylamine--glycine ligase [Sedimentisphaerales bacterium]